MGAGGPAGFAAGQVVTVFRSQRRPEAEAAYGPVAAEMEAAARAMPGFVDMKTFVADDGERVTVVTFASAEEQRAWREDPRHRRAQTRGRQEFYDSYSIQVGECTRVLGWERPSG